MLMYLTLIIRLFPSPIKLLSWSVAGKDGVHTDLAPAGKRSEPISVTEYYLCIRCIAYIVQTFRVSYLNPMSSNRE